MNILITGAGRGIGYQTALQLSLQKGITVLAMSRSRENLQRLKEEALEKNKEARVFPLLFDIETGAMSVLEGMVKEKVKKLDVLINNAGLAVKKPFEELTEEDFERVYRINVFRAASLIKYMAPLMQRSGEKRSHIVNISSIGGYQGSVKFAGLSAYSSSKAALCGLTECLAEEFKEKQIAVNCLCPGAVDTEMLRDAFPGYKAPVTAQQMGSYIAWFAVNGHHYHNGKIIPVSLSTP